MKRFFLSGVFILILGCGSASHAAFSDVFVIGDSLSDSGNAKAFLDPTIFPSTTSAPWPLVPGAPYAPSNTFTNGPVWVETFAANLGLSAFPSFLGGTNAAFGGANTGTAQFLGDSPGGIDQANGWVDFFNSFPAPIPGDSLWVIWLGGNDIRDAAGLADASAANQLIVDGVNNIDTIVTSLANIGAQNFLIPNVSDLSLAPEATLAGTYLQDASALTMQFNNGLAARIADLEMTLAVNIIELDVFSSFNTVINNPGLFGFTNTTDPCLEIGGSGVCSNPDEYLFWDGIHPTAMLHAQTAALATAAVVPVPAALPLFLSALLGFGFWGRRRY